jgi:2',3'-cyclic-nucleotide 2'-phosphodiesterase (5'-nucleotidase family)
VDATVNNIPIVQARSSGTAVSTIDLGADRIAHHVYDVLPDSLAPDPVIANLVADAVSKVATLVNRPIAVFATDLNREGTQYALGNLLADAFRTVGNGDVAVINNGGVRANVRAGQATYGSLFEVAPFGNVLYRVTVKGNALRAYFERMVARRINVHISGAKLTYDSTKTTGPRLVSAVMSDGREVRDDATYSIVMTDFLVTGGDGLGLANAAIKTEPLNIADLDALIQYLRAQPQPVRAPAEPRITAVAPAR